MRLHVKETDTAQQLDLFKDLVAKISFLRMVTPRKPGETSTLGTGNFVLRNGELVQGEGRGAGTRWVVILLNCVPFQQSGHFDSVYPSFQDC